MIVIVGTGRSGTVSLQEWLTGSERVHAVHEPEPKLIDEVVGRLQGEVASEALVERLRATRSPRVGGREYAESNHVLSYAIPEVQASWEPGVVRYVWVIRDGRAVVSSLLDRGTFDAQAEEDQKGEWLKRRFNLTWFGLGTRGDWNRLTPLEKACWYWEATNGKIERDLTAVPERMRVRVRLEDLDRDRDRLASFLGLGELRGRRVPVANQNRRSEARNHWTGWNREQRDAFARICGARMDRDYPEWRSASGQWRTTFRPTLRTRVAVGTQRRLRAVLFSRSIASRVLLAGARRLPERVKQRARHLLGLVG